MNIPQHIKEKLDRLYSNRFLGEKELKNLEDWLNQVQSDKHAEQWLSSNWEIAENIDIEISFDEIRRRIASHEKKSRSIKLQQWINTIQRAAAFLAIPLLILSLWLIMNHGYNSSSMVLATAKGEHTHVILPDGSEVWLNVDSRLEYSTDFNLDNRNLKLIGEGFFKVAKGKKFPFKVAASNFVVKAIGTEFNISAYDDGILSTVYMKEGKVEFKFNLANTSPKSFQMIAGQKATINSQKRNVNLQNKMDDGELLWMKGELSFTNEPLEGVFHDIERWYNVKIEFNPDEFVKETLTLHLEKDEPIAKLFEIMNQAVGINVKQNENSYVVRKK